jgi:hypothetical protein
MHGIFDAKIKSYGTTTTNAGSPNLWVDFEFQHDGATKTKKWFSGFVGGQKDITYKSLLAMGLAPQNFGRLQEFMNGVASNLLDMNKMLTIDIQEEPDYKDPSKIVSKIKWVNDPNQAPQIAKIDEATNAQFFGSMNCEGELMAMAQTMGLQMGGQTQQAPQMNNQMPPQQNYQAPQNQAPQQNMNQQQMPPQQNQQYQAPQQNMNQQQGSTQAPTQMPPQQNGAGFNAPF